MPFAPLSRVALVLALWRLSACAPEPAHEPAAVLAQAAPSGAEVVKLLKLRETVGGTTKVYPVILSGDAQYRWSSGFKLLCDDCARALAAFGLPLQATEIAPTYDTLAALSFDNGLDDSVPIEALPLGIASAGAVLATYRVVDAAADAETRYLVRLRAAPHRLYATDCASFLEVAQGSLESVPVNQALLAYWGLPARPPRIGCSSLSGKRLPPPAPAESVSLPEAPEPVVEVWRATRPHRDFRAATYLYLVTQAPDGTRRGFPLDCGSEGLDIVRALGFHPDEIRAEVASEAELEATGWERHPVIRCPSDPRSHVLAVTSGNDPLRVTRFRFGPQRHVFAFTCREAESFFRERARSQLDVPLQAVTHLDPLAAEEGVPTEVFRIDCRDTSADACARAPEPGFTPLISGADASLRGFRLAGTPSWQTEGCELKLGGSGSLTYAAEHLPAAYTLRLDWLATAPAASVDLVVGFGHPSLGPRQAYAGSVEVAMAPSGRGNAATGAIAGVAAPSESAEHPLGQWNAFELRVSPSRVAVWLNGRPVNDYALAEGRVVRDPAFVRLETNADPPIRFRNLHVRVERPVARFGTLASEDGMCVDVFGAERADGARVQIFPCHGGLNQDFTMAGDGTLRTLGKCLDAEGLPSAEAGVQLVRLQTCGGHARQRWIARDDGSLVNEQNGRCLDLQRGATATETPLVTRVCQPGLTSQRWRTPSAPARFGPLLGYVRGCVDIYRSISADGAVAQTVDCHGGINQDFTLPADGTMRVLGKCLDRGGPPNAAGARTVQLSTCTGSADQTFLPQRDGTLVNPASGLCLDVEGGGEVNESRLMTTPCQGSTTQRWTIPFLARSAPRP